MHGNLKVFVLYEYLLVTIESEVGWPRDRKVACKYKYMKTSSYCGVMDVKENFESAVGLDT